MAWKHAFSSKGVLVRDVENAFVYAEGLVWLAWLAPPVHPEDAQGAFSCCRGDGSSESHGNRVGLVGEPRVIRVGFVSAACGNRVGAAWERRWIQGNPR